MDSEAWKGLYLPVGLYNVDSSCVTVGGTSGATVPCVFVPE